MTHEELVEKVAAVIDKYTGFYSEEDQTDCCEEILKAILAALQEPTEGMIIAANSLPQGYGKTWIWRAMLDASPLGEQSE